jgi:hypothetical protein
MEAVALLAAATLTTQAQAPAETWTTVEDYQFVTGAPSSGRCMTADAAGNVFTGGLGFTGPGLASGLILWTNDASEAAGSWPVADDFNPGSAQAVVTGLAFDSSGNLWSVGTVYNPCTQASCSGFWYLRMSPTPTILGSWTNVSTFQYADGQVCVASSITADLSGNVFVAGHSSDARGVNHWLVRKYSSANPTGFTVEDIPNAVGRGIGFVPSVGLFAAGSITTTAKGTTTTSWVVLKGADGGSKWSTVDVVTPPPGCFAMARAVATDKYGNIYVAGQIDTPVGAKRPSVVSQWLVRQSLGGATWATADAFSYLAGKSSYAFGMGMDSTGNPVVAGIGTDSAGTEHWLVRRPVQGVWNTVDDYQLASGQPAVPGLEWVGCVTADAANNVLVTGGAADATGVDHWIVRRTNP